MYTPLGRRSSGPRVASYGFLFFYVALLLLATGLVSIGVSIAYVMGVRPATPAEAAAAANTTVCEAGQGGTMCAPCALGTYSAGGTLDACAACAAGTYADAVGASACSACPAECNHGTLGTCDAATGVCTVCDPGYGGANCTACPLGTFSGGNNALEECSACAPGTYAATTGSTACTPCLARCDDVSTEGTCNVTSGACTVCDAGHGGPVCAACPLGTFSGGNNTLEDCTACPTGTFAAMVGLSACLPCPAECNTTCGITTGSCLATCNATASNSVDPLVLGNATGFALLSHAGITNVAPSDITGDVGVHPIAGSSSTTLTCAEITGTFYTNDGSHGGTCDTTDAVLLTRAKNDLTAARLDALGRTPNATLSGENQLDGLTLVAGVYVVSPQISNLAGTLTLDGEGDPNAVWIFQVTTTLITGAGSAVVLTNCAQSCNVFWALGTTATLATNSVMVGTLMAGAAVNMLTGASINGGSAMTLTESITLQSNTITLVPCD